MLTKKLIFQLLLCILLLGSCSKKNKDSCPSVLKLTASSITPTVGDRLTLYAGNGQSIYNWVGPQNFAIVKTDGSDILEFADIKINQSGWYYCGASIPGCTTLSDSIYITLKPVK